MKKLLTTTLLLAACASDATTTIEPPDEIIDGKGDSWSRPTSFGRLFENTWLFGDVDAANQKAFPAWTFTLDGNAKVDVTSRVAPTDEPELAQTAMYLYQQRDTGTWKRIAKSTSATEFASIAANLGAGAYRVIVTGKTADAYGQFLVRLDCSGDGCADGAQCLMGDAFWEARDVKEGALIDYGSKTLTATSTISDALKAQIIAAVNESAHSVTTLAEAFEAVDQNEVNRYRFWDNLAGRSLIAIEYGAGDNSYGAWFVEDSAEVVAGIHDGDHANCTIAPRACVFGQAMGEAAYMPDMTSTQERTFEGPSSEIDAVLEKQILAAVRYDQPLTLAEAFESVDDSTFYVENLRHADGREWVVVHYYGGDNPVGTYFRAGSAEPVASIGDGEIGGCTEF